MVEPELLSLSDDGIRLRLPENSHEVSLRKAARYPCCGIRVQAIQNSVVFEGFLLDFNAISFRVELTAESPQTFEWIHPEHTIHLLLSDEKLYNLNSQIARHFIYQEKGRILGHMSMLRFYANSWLIQHHAAKTSAGHKAGLMVLDQIGRMVTESHRLHSLQYSDPYLRYLKRLLRFIYHDGV
jgi:hypothetical protein